MNAPRKKKINVTILRRMVVMVTLAFMVLTVAAQNQDEPRLLFSEDFSLFTATTTKNLANELDTYTHSEGWKGANIFSVSNNGGAVRIGTSSYDGYILTPPVTSTTGTIGVYVQFKDYNSKATTLAAALAEIDDYQYIFNEDGSDALRIQVFEVPASDDYITLTTNLSYVRPCRVRFDPNHRGYICSIKIYDGAVPSPSVPTSAAVATTDASSPLLYNVNGQRVTSEVSLRNGIYIQKDGRKVIKRLREK